MFGGDIESNNHICNFTIDFVLFLYGIQNKDLVCFLVDPNSTKPSTYTNLSILRIKIKDFHSFKNIGNNLTQYPYILGS
jgi:hypothetical protein